MNSEYKRYLYRPRPRWVKILVISALLLVLLHWEWSNFSDTNTSVHLQYHFLNETEESAPQYERLEAIKSEFLHAWYGYKNHSWMSDSLKPISGGSENRYCGWSATLIDSLDTLYIMGLSDEFDLAIDAVVAIDFQKSAEECKVNFFESTIRYLGGLLAAYDLSMDQRLQDKAIELAEVLYLAFNTTTGMPCNHCYLTGSRCEAFTVPDNNTPLADAFSFSLEFLRVWQITGNKKYLEKVLFVSKIFLHAQDRSAIPGLWPERVDASSVEGLESKFISSSTTFGLGALSDSAYEYLVKTHLMMLGNSNDQFGRMWNAASEQIKKHLLFHAYIPQTNQVDALFAGIAKRPPELDQPILEPRIEHLACFAGGMFALSSRIFHKPEDMAAAKALAEGCIWAYENSPVGIMPETVTLTQCPEPHGIQCPWQDAPTSNSNYPPGYAFSIDTHYGLRPEAVESLFVLYRLTGENRWREVGWKMFTDIIKQTRAPYGHASLKDVVDVSWQDGVPVAEQRDEMESFWLAETLKYFYLLFSDPHLVSLDEFVLNTEAHPLRLTKRHRRILW